MHTNWRHFSAIILALAAIFAIVAPASAYNPYGFEKRYSEKALEDNQISVCYGVRDTEHIYVHRSEIARQLRDTWGQLFRPNNVPITFPSNGLCNNDGSELQILWDRNIYCPSTGAATWGYVNTTDWTYTYWAWDEQTIWLNANCNILGRFDWTPGNGISTSLVSAVGITLHEAGHAFGLDHERNYAYTIMNDDNGSTPNACTPLNGHHIKPATDDSLGLYVRYANRHPFASWSTNTWTYCNN